MDLMGIWGYEGYAGHYWRDEVGYDGRGDMRDGPPPRNRAVGSAVFWTAPPQSTKGGKKERQTTSQPKRNAYFKFKLLIINDINQYFNIHLHLISFIIYNRRIFIVKYLFENKTCIIFAM